MEEAVSNNPNKKIPIGVKIIAVLVIISGFLSAILSILLMVGLGSQFPIPASFILGGGIMFLIAGALVSFVGFMLWKGKNWAREVIILFAVLGTVGGVTSTIRGDYYSIITLIINGSIAGYLWFSASVKEAFKK